MGTALSVWVGSAAAFLTTISFVPQAVHVLRTRHTHGISLPMYVLFTAGVALWLAYGVMIVSWPVIIGNVITLVLATIILHITWQNRRHPPQ